MTETLFDRVLAQHPGDEEGRMLHAPALKTGGKAYAFVAGPDVIVKLPASRVAGLIRDGLGQPCAPRAGRPMREWVRIADPDEETRLSYIMEARAFVTG
jgi:hypothetical protein